MALWSLAARAGIPAARSALRFLSRMKKPPSGDVTLFRGQFAKSPIPLKEMKKMYTPTGSKFDFNNPELRKMALGRWFSNKPSMAMDYAGNRRYLSMFKNPKDVLSWGGGYEPGVVSKLTLTAKEARIANK